MGKQAITAFLRIRPSTSCPTDFIKVSNDKKVVQFLADVGGGIQQSFQFKFDKILDGSNQEEVYEVCAQKAVDDVLNGYSGTVMCYGQTGAGKTYTATGARSDYSLRGLIPRALHHVFATLKRAGASAVVRVSYLEIYNEHLYDLLDPTAQPQEAALAEDSRGRVHPRGISNRVVHTEAEALAFMFEGDRNRSIGEHQLNHDSSRSHAIFTLSLEMKQEVTGERASVVSKLNVVDLAGSERVWKTKSVGAGLKEAGAINKSLSILEQVILALTERNRGHVPYRSSKLTHFLKDSLGGNCRTVLVTNVWAELRHIGETLSTCRFGQRIQSVHNYPSVDFVQDESARVKQLERQIDDLKHELSMHDSFARRSSIVYRPYNASQRSELQAQVLEFFHGFDIDSISPLELLSLRHMREILMAIKTLHQKNALPGGSNACGGLPAASTSPNSENPSSACPLATDGLADTNQEEEEEEEGCVGDLDGSAKYVVAGVAPSHSKPKSVEHNLTPPPTSVRNGYCREARLWDDTGTRGPPSMPNIGAGSSSMPGDSTSSQGDVTSTSRSISEAVTGAGEHFVRSEETAGPADSSNESILARIQNAEHPRARHVPERKMAFEDFKAGPGRDTMKMLSKNKARIKEVKRKARELSVHINGCKRDLDQLLHRSEVLTAMKRNQHCDNEDMEAERGHLALRIREQKLTYRSHMNDLHMMKSELAYTDNLVHQCTEELVGSFNEWYEDAYGSSPPQVEIGFSGARANSIKGAACATSSCGRTGRSSWQSALPRSDCSRGKVLGSLIYADDPGAALYYTCQRSSRRSSAGSESLEGGVGRGALSRRGKQRFCSL